MKSFDPKIYKRRRILVSLLAAMLVLLGFYIFKILDNTALHICLGYLYLLFSGFIIFQLHKWITDMIQGEQLIVASNNKLVQWIGWALYFTLMSWMVYSNYGTENIAFLRSYFPGIVLLILINRFWISRKEEPKILFQNSVWWIFKKTTQSTKIAPPTKIKIEGYNIIIQTADNSSHTLLNLRMNSANKKNIEKFSSSNNIPLEKDE